MKSASRYTVIITGALLLGCVAQAQDYREQIKLIRPRPENCLVYGAISLPDNSPSTDTRVSLVDPGSHQILEFIPTDRNGWYFFTVRKGAMRGLLIEREGFFPYYQEFTVPVDHEESSLEHPVTLADHLRNHLTLSYPAGDTLPDNRSLEMISRIGDILAGDPSLVVWLNAGNDDLDPVRINQVTGRLLSVGIPLSRIISGPRPAQTDTVIEVAISSGPSLPALTGTSDASHPDDESWTIQFTASKRQSGLKTFKDMEPVFEFKGRDGFYRYTYGVFPTREAALEKLSFVQAKGYRQAFAKQVKSIRQL